MFALIITKNIHNARITSLSSRHLSKRHPDPPIFDGDKAEFENWLGQMKTKLSQNADWFNSEKSMVLYASSRLGKDGGGDALRSRFYATDNTAIDTCDRPDQPLLRHHKICQCTRPHKVKCHRANQSQ